MQVSIQYSLMLRPWLLPFTKMLMDRAKSALVDNSEGFKPALKFTTISITDCSCCSGVRRRQLLRLQYCYNTE